MATGAGNPVSSRPGRHRKSWAARGAGDTASRHENADRAVPITEVQSPTLSPKPTLSVSEHAKSETDPIRILIGNRPLFSLVMAFAALTFGEWAYVTALSVDAFRRDGEIAVGIVGLRLFVGAISSLAGSALVKRRSPQRVLSAIALLRAIGLVASAVIAALGAPVALLLVLLGLDAVASAQYRPVQSALVPTLVRSPKEVVASVTSLSMSKTLAQALGAAAGGIVLTFTSPAAVFSGVAAIFLLSSLTTARFVTRSVSRVVPEPSVRFATRGALDAMRESVAAVRDKYVMSILVASGLRTFVRGMWLGLTVIASIRLLDAGSTGVGLLMFAAGVGSFVAAPVSRAIVMRSRLGTPAAVALTACGLPLAVIAGLPVFAVAMALIVAWGVGMAVADVTTSSLLYRLVEIPVVPRVTGTIESAKLALEGLGGFLAPVLAATIGVKAAILAAAGPLPIVVVAGWRTLHRVDASAGTRQKTLDLLHGVQVFRPLDIATLDSLVGRLVRLEIPDSGTDIVRQGDHGDSFYVIESGAAEVFVDQFVVGLLEEGTGFGERALLRNVPRTATVRSRTPMTLLMLSRDDFLAALTGQEEVPHGSAGKGTLGSGTLASGTEWTRRQRIEVLRDLALFSHLSRSDIEALADRSVVDRWPEGVAIFEQGDVGDRFFVLLEGRCSARVDGTEVNGLRPGDQFGEIALIHEVPRSADIVTLTPVTALSIARDDFIASIRSEVLLG